MRTTRCYNTSCNKDLKLYPFIRKCYLCPARAVVIDSSRGNCPSCKNQLTVESNPVQVSTANEHQMNVPAVSSDKSEPKVVPPVSPPKVNPVPEPQIPVQEIPTLPGSANGPANTAQTVIQP